MAPVTATNTGMPRQTIDDPELIKFIRALSLCNIAATSAVSKTNGSPPDQPALSDSMDNIERLIAEISKHTKWRFQEQVCLFFVFLVFVIFLMKLWLFSYTM